MPASELDQMIAESTAEVLETMFFTCVAETAGAEYDSSQTSVAAQLTFHGAPSGSFGLALPARTAREIAAGFMGEDEETLPEARVGEVVCELANMICGSMLSRLESHTCFELHHPELSNGEVPPAALSRIFELEHGTLRVWLNLNQT
jgi:CheY-specific phosphatase CheX